MKHRSLRALVSLSVLAATFAASPTAAAPKHGSEAQRLHDKGVHCMDEIERNACAITHFEALLKLETRERELVTDAMMRLIDLYRDEGRDDDVAVLLRRFWSVGMKLDSHGHVPWSTRFIPSELDMLLVVDMQQMVGSRVIKTLSEDARDSLLTCDEDRRNELEIKRRFRRAEKRAAKEHQDVWQALQDQQEHDAARRAKRAEGRSSADAAPIFAEHICDLARALGKTDLKSVRKIMGAVNHHDARKSIGIAEIPELDPLLVDAEAKGRLRRVAADHFILVDAQYAGAPVHVLKLDHDELTLVPESMAAALVEARSKRRAHLNRELGQLVSKVPRDAGFFFVMTQAAMREMGFSGVKKSTRAFLEALLPKPKGLQIAAIFGDHLGVFTRVPTDTPGRGRMLISVANAMVSNADDDEETSKWLEGLDIAESSDRKALLASYLISAGKLQKLMLQ